MKTCIVVDDVKFDRMMLVRCATSLGFEVIEAASGKEALELCKKQLPDCMLIDWEMKGMTGVELMEKLRELEGGDTVCALMCTSHEHFSFVGHAYMSGAYGFISKPITKEKLKQTLDELGLFNQ